MTLLIVEDNRQMRQMIRRAVEDIAAEIYECGDGAGAVAAYREHRPDWVLMDLQMGEMDGLTATRDLVSAFPAAKILIVTNHDHPRLRQAAREAGACEYVVKENLLAIRPFLGNLSRGEGRGPQG